YIQQLKELNKPQVKIRLETPLSDDKAVIYTDENRFVQIFNNLITNAIKFTKEGEIRIGYEIVSDDKLHFFVKDTGVGIENSQKEQIFEEFHQIGPSGRGKGLGLSISKQLVTYLGGEIWLKSELGKGSAFFFSLPYDFNKQSDTLETAPLKKAVAPETKKNNVDWSDKKVMIVDDAKDVLTFVSILLRKTNVQIDTALTGSEALQKINESDGGYNLILMDIQMPGISGVEALKRIKESHPDLPVFAQTAFALEGDEARFLKKGFDAYIPKPVNRNELLRKMTPFMEH
ncbi:MAG TPA: ATP-binding protein, partial [Bacteroidales bacterium]|nr:ATP-binding protein [Bacteroidales bacterium]